MGEAVFVVFCFFFFISERLMVLTDAGTAPAGAASALPLPSFSSLDQEGAQTLLQRLVRGAHKNHPKPSPCLTHHRSPRLGAWLTPTLGTHT